MEGWMQRSRQEVGSTGRKTQHSLCTVPACPGIHDCMPTCANAFQHVPVPGYNLLVGLGCVLSVG